jgi:hypothetical protein
MPKLHGTNPRARHAIEERRAAYDRAERRAARHQPRREGPMLDDKDATQEERPPVVAVYSVRITLRAPEGTPVPTLDELSEKLANGLGWGYVSTIEGERVDQ